MKQVVKKDAKVALCRNCHGTGYIENRRYPYKMDICSQCEGSGRVTVSADMQLDIRPYKPKTKPMEE